jgi:hypothetical protein
MSGNPPNEEFDEDLPDFDEDWVRSAAHSESSADERADRYARINAGHQRVQDGEQSWRGDSQPQKRGGLSLARWTLAILGILALIVFVVWVFGLGRPLVDEGPVAYVGGDEINQSLERSTSVQLTKADFPPPKADAQATRILPAVEPPPEGGEFDFLAESGGEPVTYSPCRRLEVVVNPRGGPPGSYEAVEQTVEQIRQATGLDLTVAGETDETYSSGRDPVQPERYGDRWAPILVTWTESELVPQFQGNAVGLGGSLQVTTKKSPASYVTGEITLNREYFSQPTTAGLLKEVLLHEFGHVVGLGHVEDQQQVMTSEALGGRPLGDGDLAGLALLGQGPCTPNL